MKIADKLKCLLDTEINPLIENTEKSFSRYVHGYFHLLVRNITGADIDM
jgi:hypothetical protein